jgi:hypothetical protein
MSVLTSAAAAAAAAAAVSSARCRTFAHAGLRVSFSACTSPFVLRLILQ